MTGSKEKRSGPSAASLERLRYFRYFPPLGGFGGDGDTLSADARFADDAELGRILGALGYAGEPPLEERDTLLGFFTVGGVEVQLSVTRRSLSPESENRVHIGVALYVTQEDVANARRLEEWLDAHAIAMIPRRR